MHLRWHRLLGSVAFLVPLLGLGSRANAGSGTATLFADSFIKSTSPTNNWGGNAFIRLGGAFTTTSNRGLLRYTFATFKVAGRVTITTATLSIPTLVMNYNPPPNLPTSPGTYRGVNATGSLYRITSDWVEGSSSGGGLACTSGTGASWNSPKCDATTWGISPSTTNATVPGNVGTAVWNVVTDLQAWMDGTANYGWMIVSSSENGGFGQKLDSANGSFTYSYNCKAGFRTNGNLCEACGAATTGDSNCKAGTGTNACTDTNSSSAPFFTCTCGTGFSGNGTTLCTDIPGCSGNPCDNNGDSAASCFDVAGPGVGNTCTCGTAGYVSVDVGSNVHQCVNQCTANSLICGNGGTCSAIGGTGTWTCACPTGYTSNLAAQAACVDQNACDSTAKAACKETDAFGATLNKCVDNVAPATGYTCTCSGAQGYSVSGASCVDTNGCAGINCKAGGDSSGTCVDVPARGTGHTCTCNTMGGYIDNGTTCVRTCGSGPDPCGGAGVGTCSGTTTWTCSCATGYVTTGGSTPSCVDLNACNSTANSACQTTQGNTCVDELPPSTGYHCTCGAAYAGTNTTSCHDRNECGAPDTGSDPCIAGGDTGASEQCTDHVAPIAGHDCTCDVGFSSNGTTCVSQCGSGSDPCGVHGTCSIVNAGGWTCACATGYVSSGGATPNCNTQLDACDATALAACTSAVGNSCVDEAPPSTTYHCSCTNAAYVVGTVAGKSACVDKDECSPTNHCRDNGDTGATCIDRAAPQTGFDCSCTSLWTVDSSGANPTCVDRNECASGNPCEHGVCTNIAAGGGYSCVCDAGYQLYNGDTPTPICFHTNNCDAAAKLNCVESASGNACVDLPPPQSGYECNCQNPAYMESGDHKRCVDHNSCATGPCSVGGDHKALCTDFDPPKAGYSCACAAGFVFDGKTCADVNECSEAVNPCGKGQCNNAKGSYQCVCGGGLELVDGLAPTCKDKTSGYVSYRVENGFGCSAAGSSNGELWMVAFVLLGLALRARARYANSR